MRSISTIVPVALLSVFLIMLTYAILRFADMGTFGIGLLTLLLLTKMYRT
jgi:hypothetical protein